MNFKKLNFCYFGFDQITTYLTKEGKETKFLKNLPFKAERSGLTPETSYTGVSTGILCGAKSNITVIDCDTPEAYDSLLAGYPDFKDYYTVQTNKGYHIYCSYCDQIKTSIKEIKDIDILNDGAFVIAPPTKYRLLNGSLAQYRFIGGTKLGVFPPCLLSQLNKMIKNRNTTTNNNILYECDYLQCIQQQDIKKLVPFFRMLKPKRFHEYNEWIQTGFLFYSLGCPWQLWDRFCQQSSKYQEGACEYHWSTFTSKKWSVGTLYHWCKEDSPEEFYQYKKKFNFEMVLDTPIQNKNIEYHNIEEAYLLENDLVTIKPSVDTHLERLFTDDSVSSLNIKSPYGTSKTQLLIKTIEKYEPKKILFLSYRKSLTYDLQNNFDKLAFHNYLEHSLDSNRLIMQSESLLKLDRLSFDGEVPKFDLVVIDESESVLNNFNSQTFDGKAETIYDYLRAIIENCGKLITLDGDQHNRTYAFTSSFPGKSINIINTINNNQKKLILTDSEYHYKCDIYNSLETGKKIVICSQSASMAETYYNELKEKYPDLKMSLTIGKTDDTTKTEQAKDINLHWEVDVLIYSPSVEAGCNFDKVWFDKEYLILSTGANSQRAVFQMLARVRKFKSNDILTYTNGIKDYDIGEFYTFYDVKDAILESREKVLKYGYERDVNGILRRVVRLESYDINNIYNRVEDLNKNEKYFMPYFKTLAISKGFKVEYLDLTEVNPFSYEEEEEKTEGKYDELINAKDIDDDELLKLYQKQNKSKASRADKLSVEKAVWKQRLGVSKLNEDILKTFHKKEYLINNFLALVDPNNKKLESKSTFDDKREDVEYRLLIVNQIINCIGFKDINDTTVLSESQFDDNFVNNLAQNPIFNESSKTVKVRFNLSKSKTDPKDKDSCVKFINELFKNFSIKLERTYQKGKRKEKQNRIYQIVILNNVDEIVYNLIQSKRITLTDDASFIEPTEKVFSELL